MAIILNPIDPWLTHQGTATEAHLVLITYRMSVFDTVGCEYVILNCIIENITVLCKSLECLETLLFS